MARKTLKTAVALPLIALLTVCMGACGGSKKADTPSSHKNDSTSQTDLGGKKVGQDPSAAASSMPSIGDVKLGGTFSGTADGKELQLASPKVLCLDTDGMTNLTAGAGTPDPNKVTSSSVVIDQDGKVNLVQIIDGDMQMSHMKDVDEGSAEATIDGKNYTVTGKAPASGGAAGTEKVLKPFELKFTCG